MKLANEYSLYSYRPTASKRSYFRLAVSPAFSRGVALIVRLDVEPGVGADVISFEFREKPLASIMRLTSNQASEFEKAFLATDFTPASYPKIDYENERRVVTIGIRDGHGWLFESLVNGKYRCMERSAHEAGTFQDMARLLLKLAGKDTNAFR